MTPRQGRIVAILAIADIIVIAALAVLMTRPPPFPALPSLPPTPTLSYQACRWRATQLLAQAGLSGTATLSPNRSPLWPVSDRATLLRFEISYPLAPGQTADEAAQSVWTAFDIALALQEEGCAIFTQVEVTVLVHNGVPETKINASASTADLMAFDSGTLSEDEFIERVTYTAPIH